MGKRGAKKHIKHKFNTEFDKLLSDLEHGELDDEDYRVIKSRPAYAYTSLCPDKRFRQQTPFQKLSARAKKNE